MVAQEVSVPKLRLPTALRPVRPFIYVGGQGTSSNGGYDGGGQGYDTDDYGGGGVSDVRQGGTTLGNRIIVGGR